MIKRLTINGESFLSHLTWECKYDVFINIFTAIYEKMVVNWHVLWNTFHAEENFDNYGCIHRCETRSLASDHVNNMFITNTYEYNVANWHVYKGVALVTRSLLPCKSAIDMYLVIKHKYFFNNIILYDINQSELLYV